jgi:hypothetical protein
VLDLVCLAVIATHRRRIRYSGGCVGITTWDDPDRGRELIASASMSILCPSNGARWFSPPPKLRQARRSTISTTTESPRVRFQERQRPTFTTVSGHFLLGLRTTRDKRAGITPGRQSNQAIVVRYTLAFCGTARPSYCVAPGIDVLEKPAAGNTVLVSPTHVGFAARWIIGTDGFDRPSGFTADPRTAAYPSIRHFTSPRD